jgi:hypothetical protein
MQAAFGEAVAWGNVEHLLAGVVDALQVGNFIAEVVATDRRFKHSPRPPVPLRRPGDPAPQRPATYRPEQIQGLLDGWRGGDVDMTETESREVT